MYLYGHAKEFAKTMIAFLLKGNSGKPLLDFPNLFKISSSSSSMPSSLKIPNQSFLPLLLRYFHHREHLYPIELHLSTLQPYLQFHQMIVSLFSNDLLWIRNGICTRRNGICQLITIGNCDSGPALFALTVFHPPALLELPRSIMSWKPVSAAKSSINSTNSFPLEQFITYLKMSSSSVFPPKSPLIL